MQYYQTSLFNAVVQSVKHLLFNQTTLLILTALITGAIIGDF